MSYIVLKFHGFLRKQTPERHLAGEPNEKAASPTATHTKFQRSFIALAVLVLTGIGVARIVSTYHVFNQTVDEAAHLAAGMEWLDRGTYTLETSHPPLARIAIALGPFLSGLRLPPGGNYTEVGNKILYARDQYFHNLALARLGVLPFFVLATIAVFVWSRKAFGDASALLSVALFTTLPPVLAHAGMATNDMAITATFAIAMLASVYFLEHPTYFRAGVLGFTVGVAVISKLSGLLFVPACGLALFACYRLMGSRIASGTMPWRRKVVTAAVILATIFVVIWAGYRFSVGISHRKIHRKIDALVGTEGHLHRLAYLVANHTPIPAPVFIVGIRELESHDLAGHTAYLLGEVRKTGWWYFFPVTLAVKSPLPFLILSGIGFAALGRRLWRGADWRAISPAAMAVIVLVICMLSRIDIGVRHILPIYPLLAIVAGFGGLSLWNLARPRKVGPAILVVLLLWLVVNTTRAHPDYLAYFNELASRHPDKVLVEGDLDWGQDLQRLANVLRDKKIDSVALVYHGNAEPGRHILGHWWNLQPCEVTTGWVAISEFSYKIGWWPPEDQTQSAYRVWAWLDAYKPRAMVGKSIRLYYIPVGAAPKREAVSGFNGCP